MAYTVYSEGFQPVDLDSLGAAIEVACDMIREGGIVSRITGSSGLLMERGDIEMECARRAHSVFVRTRL